MISKKYMCVNEFIMKLEKFKTHSLYSRHKQTKEKRGFPLSISHLLSHCVYMYIYVHITNLELRKVLRICADLYGP